MLRMAVHRQNQTPSTKRRKAVGDETQDANTTGPIQGSTEATGLPEAQE
jgi:hypothetical protein